jgi:hypothetical protein
VVSAGLLWLLFSRVDVGRLWSVARQASPVWLTGALLLYLTVVLASAVRWDVLLRAQHVRLPFSFLTQSFLVATFFNNFLPSNIGGDVIRISDTAKPAGSKTLADHRRPHRSRTGPARTGVDGGHGGDTDAAHERWTCRPRHALGRFWRRRDDRDTGAAHARDGDAHSATAARLPRGVGRRTDQQADLQR